jgi:hypothetical protein
MADAKLYHGLDLLSDRRRNRIGADIPRRQVKHGGMDKIDRCRREEGVYWRGGSLWKADIGRYTFAISLVRLWALPVKAHFSLTLWTPTAPRQVQPRH